MSLTKRLRVLWAALTQRWQLVTCRCGAALWVSSDVGRLLDGQMCDVCEARAFEQWKQQYDTRNQSKGAA